MALPWEGEGQEQRRRRCFSVAVAHALANMEDFLVEAAMKGLGLGVHQEGGGTGVFPEGTWPGNTVQMWPLLLESPAETQWGPCGYRQSK